MNKKLLTLRFIIILFIAICISTSYTLNSEADCLIMFFTFLLSLGYLGAEILLKKA
jgi:hypothetical protein